LKREDRFAYQDKDALQILDKNGKPIEIGRGRHSDAEDESGDTDAGVADAELEQGGAAGV
jgi:hypothetical protein